MRSKTRNLRKRKRQSDDNGNQQSKKVKTDPISSDDDNKENKSFLSNQTTEESYPQYIITKHEIDKTNNKYKFNVLIKKRPRLIIRSWMYYGDIIKNEIPNNIVNDYIKEHELDDELLNDSDDNIDDIYKMEKILKHRYNDKLKCFEYHGLYIFFIVFFSV